MPVSVAVCDTANVVNAALRESLGESKTGGGGSNNNNGSGCDEAGDNLQSQIVANAKRVLLTKIEYEEVENYSESVLENLKSKYIVIKPNNNNGTANCNGGSGGGYGNKNSSGSNNVGKIVGANGHENSIAVNVNGNRKQSSSSEQHQQQQNPNELPKPVRVLYPRERIRIGWKQSERKWQVGTGLLNVGNTCYLNSTLQALFHIPALANWLVSETAHLDNCNIVESGGCCIICAMIKTLLSTQSSTSTVRPFHIYSKLKQICKHMVVGRQEDAHEFLRFLVEAMEKAYLMRDRNYKELDQLVKETTPLNQIFGGYLRSAVRCLSCSHVSITFQHFQDLLLDIRKADTLEEAFDGYFARERLEDMGYKCEGCKKKVSATKQFSLERAPITLCIQLKRFSMMGTKLTKQITFKPRIDLSKYAARSPAAAAQPLTYRLVSLVTHLGVTQHCGHYTAIGLTEAGGYYNFDDSYVRPIQIHSVCSTNAYIMFYELDAPATPARSMGQPMAAAAASGVANSAKMNGLRLSNGQHSVASGLASASSMSSSAPASPTRFIGPQLPPGGLNGYASAPASNGHPKIAIHYKNTSLQKQTAVNGASQKHQQHQQQQLGLLVGSGKFQESKPALAGASAAVANGNKSSCANASQQNQHQHQHHHTKAGLPLSSEDEDDDAHKSGGAKRERQAQSRVNAMPQLPSMPKLFSLAASSGSGNGATTPKALAPLLPKSLVPYESASEEEEQLPVVVAVAAAAAVMGNSNARKRRSGADSASSEEEEVELEQQRNGNGHCTTNGKANNKNNNNNSKQKTDAIDEIFKSLNNYKSKHKSTANPDTDDGDDEEDEEEQLNNTNASNGWRPQKSQQQLQSQSLGSSRTPPSPKTPPSPAVIKTKTGIWQITRNDEDVEEPEEAPHAAVSPKNHKNPFASTKILTSPAAAAASKRQKLHNGNAKSPQHARLANGYQSEANSNGNGHANGNGAAVGELLKQTHRSYGAAVLSWNGKQTELDKQVLAEAREQRQRDMDDDEENEMDRGRQRKVKSAAATAAAAKSCAASGFNPFQEYENQKRWHKTSNGGSYARVYHQTFRPNFQQRNKFKFNRFGGSNSSKFQQQRALQRHLAAGGGFTRRQQHNQQQQQSS